MSRKIIGVTVGTSISPEALKKKIGMCSDWNSPEGEPGHILNRPFYSTYEETLILPACQPVFMEGEQAFMLPDSISVPAGTACTVNWNGTDYATTAQDVSDYAGASAIAMGNLDLLWPDSGFTGNGEPFAIIAFDPSVAALLGVGILILPVDGTAELTISISGNVETITPIPEKFLKNARCQKKYVIDLDNGGTLSKELWELDPAELQASMVVIHEGTEKTAVIAQRTIEHEDGIASYRMYLSVPLQTGGNCIYLCTNHSRPYLIKEMWVPQALPDGISGTFIMAKGTGDLDPTWKRMNEIALPGVLLTSTTSGSSKTFFVTADDGGLQTTDPSGNVTKIGAVKTVNGVAPDENGNVAITIPDSGGNVGLGVTGATVGQTVKIASVDENGVPTAWEAVDFPSGGAGGEKQWRKVKTITIAEDVGDVNITEDDDGKTFALSEAFLYLSNPRVVLDAALKVRFYNGSNEIASFTQSGINQSKYDVSYLRAHFYHDGFGYCYENATSTTTSGYATAAVFKDNKKPTDNPQKSITRIRFLSSHGDVKLMAGATIDIWGVDA